MPSHAVEQVRGATDIGDARVRVEAVLACGCAISVDTDAERLIDRPDGTLLLVGKYPCPAGHPIGRRAKQQ